MTQKSGLLFMLLTALFLTLPYSKLEAQETEEASTVETDDAPADFSGFKLIQPESIHLTLVEFWYHNDIRQLQEQILSIPGVSDFVPYVETPGLITYDLRYSGDAKLLFKAMEDTLGQTYEIAMKEIGEKSWEITLRRGPHARPKSVEPETTAQDTHSL